ncbi:MAG: hypothetical protein HZC43_10375 [Nitrosomonadales bacterium]|nr:hypothetical protein [Nitrosomonadales bacterium]
MNVVVDTNVAISANGRNTHAGLACQYACIVFLEELVSPVKRTHIVLDEQELIFTEYSSHLHYKGQPGVGDMFFKYLHDHMYLGKKIRLVPITPIADEARGFNELPQNSVDKNDRKFLVAAMVAGATVVNALDSGWHRQADFVADLGVSVRQLCPEHGCC